MSTRVIDVGGVRFRVLVDGSGPAALLLHGTGSCSSSFRACARELRNAFTLVIPDLPGHGDSAPHKGFVPSIPTMGKAIRSLLDVLGIEPAVAVGHSAGAAIAVSMATSGLLASERIIGIAPALVPFRGVAGVVFPAAARALARSRVVPYVLSMRAQYTDVVERLVERTGSVLDEEALACYRELHGRPEHVAGALAMMASWDLEPVWSALPWLSSRLLVLEGGRDRAIASWQMRAVVQRAPRARLVTIPDAGHLLHEELPCRVAQEILRELDAVTPATHGGSAYAARHEEVR